jgi:putative oxidoreductase
MDFLNKYSRQIQGVTRIVIGLLFLEHGTNKIFQFPMAGNASAHAWNLLAFPTGPSGLIELVAGILIVLGLFSRFAAFVASGEMAFAYFLVHSPKSAFPLLNGGGEAICYCFIFLFFAAAGPGAFAVNQK